MARLSQKHSGAYFTPEDVAACLTRWAVAGPTDRMIDPSCGDGGFLAQHRNSVGIEQDPVSARHAIERAPGALVHEGDFFQWAAQTKERFECAAGNPPFIRYQTFKGEVRERAIALCNRLGASFSGLASAWAPFLVATAGVLKPGGRMAFVVPAEIGHAPYAAPLLDYLVDHFSLAEPVAPPPAPAAGTSPFNRPYVQGGSTRPALFQVGLKNGQVYNVSDVEVKSPLFGRSHLLLDGQQRIDLAEVGFYEDQTGHYVRTTLPNSNRETTLRREKTGRISLYATYNTSYASSPYGMGMGMGGFGYGGYPFGGFGNPYGGYRTTKTDYFSKDNGPVQNLTLRNLAIATSENAGAQQLLSNARRYRQSSIAAYVVGGGLLVAGLVQSTRPSANPGISPLFYAAIPVLIVPLIFQSKQAEAQRQAIALYNSGRQ